VHFCPYLVPKQPKQKTQQFIATLRFTNENVRKHSIKMQRVEFLRSKKEHVISDSDFITYIKPAWKWDEFVWDVKTEDRRFTCGTVVNHNSFHTGGTAGTGADALGIKRVEQLFHMPKIVPGAAALAPEDGIVNDVQKGVGGGYDITVNNKKIHVPQGRNPKVKKGDTVKKGDPLSEGVIKPQELVKLKGMSAARDYLTDELHKAYQSQGQAINRKTFETVVHSLANTTRVKNNPLGTDHIPGDLVSYNYVKNHNANLKAEVPVDEAEGYKLAENVGQLKAGTKLTSQEVDILRMLDRKTVKIEKDPIKHSPTLKGITAVPLMRKDWMANLGYRYISKALTEGASQGWKTDISDYHPIPAFAYGTTFGKGKDGKY